MDKNLRFCFKIDKEVGLAQDEFGNNAEAFVCCKAKGCKKYEVAREKYKNAHEVYRKIVASQLQVDTEIVVAITLNEYLDNTEEDDE